MVDIFHLRDTPWPALIPRHKTIVKFLLLFPLFFHQAGNLSGKFFLRRLQIHIKTKNFKSSRSGVIIYNNGWLAATGTDKLPENTEGWLKLEEIVVAPESNDGYYSFGIFATASSGDLYVSAPVLEGVSEKAIVESQPALRWSQSPRIVPVEPLLNKISFDDPQMQFFFAPEVNENEYECRIRIGSSEVMVFPIKNQTVKAKFNQLSMGQNTMDIEVINKNNGHVVASNQYPIEVIKPFIVPQGKKLNVLVHELYHGKLENRGYEIINPRDGWIYISPDNAGKNINGTIGNNKVLSFREGEKTETMRFLSAGRHELIISGAAEGGTIAIRTVPEILLYPMMVHEKKNLSKFQYDLDFFKRYLWPVCNLQNSSSTWRPVRAIDQTALNELKERGIRLIGSGGFQKKVWTNSSDMEKAIRTGWSTSNTIGRTIDEVLPYSKTVVMREFSNALWNLTNYDKLVYTWLEGYGFLCRPEYHADLLAAAANVSQGKGKLLFETYVWSQPDEKSLEDHLQLMRKHLDYARRFMPNPNDKTMMIMSGLTTNGTFNINGYPEVDIKYLFDRFFNILVNDPAFENLYGTGCYNINYCDEETTRWISRLLRHYFLEGRCDMLSEYYGFTYRPGHLANGDFAAGMKGWQAEGDVKISHFAGYGFRRGQQRRVLPYGTGDTFCLFKRSVKAANLLSQTAKNLTPGKQYSLTYVTADLADVKKVQSQFPSCILPVRLENAEIIDDLTYITRMPFKDKNQKAAINTHRVVFRAKTPNVKITFSDWLDDTEPGAVAGQEQMLNFISLKPYFSE